MDILDRRYGLRRHRDETATHSRRGRRELRRDDSECRASHSQQHESTHGPLLVTVSHKVRRSSALQRYLEFGLREVFLTDIPQMTPELVEW
jgi:hypothetical protein